MSVSEDAERDRDLQFYKEKVKDVVRAYKILDNEKKSLEKIIEALNSKGGENDGEPNINATIAMLKNALADLNAEKAKREQLFLADKKALLEEIEKQKTFAKKSDELREKTEDELERMLKITDMAKELKKQVKERNAIIRQKDAEIDRIEKERAKELQDHGCVLAEMQKRFADEKKRADNLSKQIAELYRKLKSSDEAPQLAKQKETELNQQIQKLEAEVEEWKKKAAITPSVQLLQDQLTNLKKDHESALHEARLITSNSKCSGEEEQRRRELENRLVALTEQVAAAEQRATAAEELLTEKTKEFSELERMARSSPVCAKSAVDVVEDLRRVLNLIEKNHSNIDVLEIVGARAEIQQHKARAEKIEGDFEKYKLKAEAILRSKSMAKEEETNREHSSMKAVVEQLHLKLQNVEMTAVTDRNQYETAMKKMKERIGELEAAEESLRTELRNEMTLKMTEMEHEIQKQRDRTVELLAEKEQELEATRSILVSVRTEQLRKSPPGAPADPPQKLPATKKRSQGEPKPIERRRSSAHRHRSTDSLNSAIEYHLNDHVPTQLPLTNESRNIYYEEELSKKDLEIRELRSQLMNLDYRMREVEQSHLTKDLQQHEMGERLKDEIRVLESKLRLLSSNGEIEYLRNIFIQFLHSDNTSARKNIVKAMGMCLKLSPAEMKSLEKRSF